MLPKSLLHHPTLVFISSRHTKKYHSTPKRFNNPLNVFKFLPGHPLEPIQRKINQGLKRLNEAKNRIHNHLPKLTRDYRKVIGSRLKDLFINELIPMIEENKPDKLGDVDPDAKGSAFEGVYEESLHRIRMHIAFKLEIDPFRIYHHRRNNLFIIKTVEKLFDIQMNLRNLKKNKFRH
ncbi:hypothetical protein M9Y10_008356 [Tritrichomonas musculus]|uniref:Uncharacterized protein n=1 Tax=Tritrichomonas musculus TaxID=1915356 RepID=A0ABR2IYZ8_9EUKA